MELRPELSSIKIFHAHQSTTVPADKQTAGLFSARRFFDCKKPMESPYGKTLMA
jgi:hypothetical protein